MSEDVLTTGVVLKTHKILMLHQGLQPNHKGYWRDCAVWIGGREGADYKMVPILMQQWCFETMRANPAPDWQALHVQYEKIHPFVDGNGRTGRMFMNWTRIKRCDLPLLTIFADERHKYYRWFN